MTPSFPQTALLGVVLAAFPSSRGTADDDEARSPWHFKRSVRLPESAHPFASLVIPPEVGAGLQADLRDARLIDTRGREIPYVIDRVRDRRAESSWRGTLVDMRREPKAQSSWTIDLGAERVFDAIALTVPGQDFSKRLKIETSKDRISWVAREEAGIFDRAWTVRIHHTAISLGEPLDARYLRLTTDDHHSPVIEITGVAVSSSRRLRGETWTREVALERAPSAGRPTRYRLDLPPGFPAETFELQADDAAFCRRVRIFEVRERNGRREETTLGEGVVYRLRVQDAPLAGEALALQPPGGGELFLEVDDADSPPLENPRGVVSGAGTRLLFPSVDTLFTLYYGNGATRAPLYDLDALKERLATGSAFALAELGPEVPNPRFRPTSALGFVGLTGAPLDVTQWKAERRLTIMGREDLYTLTLSAEDLAYLRDDLADLRIVSESSSKSPTSWTQTPPRSASFSKSNWAGGAITSRRPRFRFEPSSSSSRRASSPARSDFALRTSVSSRRARFPLRPRPWSCSTASGAAPSSSRSTTETTLPSVHRGPRELCSSHGSPSRPRPGPIASSWETRAPGSLGMTS
jgi:hypothetical protein